MFERKCNDCKVELPTSYTSPCTPELCAKCWEKEEANIKVRPRLPISAEGNTRWLPACEHSLDIEHLKEDVTTLSTLLHLLTDRVERLEDRLKEQKQ